MYGIFITSGKATQLMDAWYHILNCSWLDQCSCHFPGRPRCEVRQNGMYISLQVYSDNSPIIICACLLVVLVQFCYHSSHFAITHNPWVWRAMRILGQVMSGLSIYCWSYQVNEHTLIHACL